MSGRKKNEKRMNRRSKKRRKRKNEKGMVNKLFRDLTG